MWNELLLFAFFVKYISEHFHYAFSTIIMFYGFVYLRLRLWCFNWVANSSFTRKLSQSYFLFGIRLFRLSGGFTFCSLTFLQGSSAAGAKCVCCVWKINFPFSFTKVTKCVTQLYAGEVATRRNRVRERPKGIERNSKLSPTIWMGSMQERRKIFRKRKFCKSLTAGIFMGEP